MAERSDTVAVVGLGKIGLPLAAQFGAKGKRVIGVDVSPAVVASINAGVSHVVEEPGLAEQVPHLVAQGQLSATTSHADAVSQAGTVVIVVPLVIDAERRVDYGNVDAATRAVAAALQPDTLVAYETTLPVGTTRTRLAPLLAEGSGLRLGQDFFLAFSPERVYSGRIFEDLRRYPKVVGGVDAASSQRAVAFYQSVLDAEVIAVSDADTAEFSKLAETTYRDVNFALANQLASFAVERGVNAVEAFRVSNLQPFSHLHAPNIGIGGHCIPVYPHLLLNDARSDELELLRVGRETNDAMAERAVAQLERALGGLRGKRVLVLGLSYRENVKELAFSVALRLLPQLRDAGAEVLAHDPLFEPDEVAHLPAVLVDPFAPLAVDAVIIQAPHRVYDRLDWSAFAGLKVVVDGRGQLDPRALAGRGVTLLSFGAPPARVG